MNWKGKLVALLLWGIALGALGTGIYITINQHIENLVFTAQVAADVDKVTRGKVIVLDARINQEGIFEVFYMNKVTNSSGSGMTDEQKTEMKEILDSAIEWTMIHRDVTIFKWSWSREDRQGNLFIYLQQACDAAHLLENNPNPNCTVSERWVTLPARNQRYR